MTTNNTFALFNDIIAALDEKPARILPYADKEELPKHATFVGVMPRSTWGLRNLTLSMATKAKGIADRNRNKKERDESEITQLKALAQNIKVCSALWAQVLRDEMPEIGNYDALHFRGEKVYGTKPTLVSVSTAKFDLIAKLRSMHAMRKGDLPPIGDKVPKEGTLIGETPPWVTALQTETVRLAVETSVKRSIERSLEDLLRVGVAALRKNDDSGKGHTAVLAANDGNLYEVPCDHSHSLAELLGKIMGSDARVEIIDLNDENDNRFV
jgi:hypothetical protein